MHSCSLFGHFVLYVWCPYRFLTSRFNLFNSFLLTTTLSWWIMTSSPAGALLRFLSSTSSFLCCLSFGVKSGTMKTHVFFVDRNCLAFIRTLFFVWSLQKITFRGPGLCL